MTYVYQNQNAIFERDDFDESSFINGPIVAVKFNGTYYKFDANFDIADQLFNPAAKS